MQHGLPGSHRPARRLLGMDTRRRKARQHGGTLMIDLDHLPGAYDLGDFNRRLFAQELHDCFMDLGADPLPLAPIHDRSGLLTRMCDQLEETALGPALEFSIAVRDLCAALEDVETEPESAGLIASAGDAWDDAA